MIIGELTDSMITVAGKFKITGRNFTMEMKCLDQGTRVNLYIVHPLMVYYAIKFCAVGTKHACTGPISVSAYSFDDSIKAFSSIRMSVDSFRPLANVDENGLLIPTNATRMRVRDHLNTSFKKLTFIIKKYIWENIEDEEVVPPNRGFNMESFALSLSDLYEDLVDAQLIKDGCNPVTIKETVSRRRTNNNRDFSRQHHTTYIHNPEVPKINWNHADLSFAVITNDRHPFSGDFFSTAG